MANIIENFNDTQLELITSGSKISYQFNEESGDYIRLTVFSDDTLRYYNHFSSNDGENGFDIYKDHNENIYVKVNEVLENGYVAEGNYTLQFDFMRDYFYSHYEYTTFVEFGEVFPEFYVHQISPSRKELRLLGR